MVIVSGNVSGIRMSFKAAVAIFLYCNVPTRPCSLVLAKPWWQHLKSCGCPLEEPWRGLLRPAVMSAFTTWPKDDDCSWVLLVSMPSSVLLCFRASERIFFKRLTVDSQAIRSGHAQKSQFTQDLYYSSILEIMRDQQRNWEVPIEDWKGINGWLTQVSLRRFKAPTEKMEDSKDFQRSCKELLPSGVQSEVVGDSGFSKIHPAQHAPHMCVQYDVSSNPHHKPGFRKES